MQRCGQTSCHSLNFIKHLYMRKFLVILTLCILAASCEKDPSNRCEGLKGAVQTDDLATIKEIVTRLAADLRPQPTANDPDGHRDNFYTLIDRLNGECDITAEALCYACVQTLPATSEIKLTIALGTHSVVRILDVRPNQSNELICSNMHE